MSIEIRNEQASDTAQVRDILQSAFSSDAESKLVDTLRANGKAIVSLVAVDGDDVFGHILFSPVSASPPSNAKGAGLAPVAVRRDAQNRGIGSALIREGLRRCKELGFEYCVVLGSPAYYQRFGFEKASRFNIQNEYGVDDEFMIIHLMACQVAGLVSYASEFAELSF